LAIEDSEGNGKDILKTMNLARVSPRIFWSIVHHYGSDLDHAFREMFPDQRDWSWRAARTRTQSAKAKTNSDRQKAEDQDKAVKRRKKEENVKAAKLEKGQSVSIESGKECVVCLDDQDDDLDDPLLKCAGDCEEYVHMSCFGLQCKPVGDWYCDGCLPENRAKFIQPKCILCKQQSGLMRCAKKGNNDNSSSSSSYTHLMCVLWTPELTVDENMQANNLPAIDPHRASLTCEVCNQRESCTQCSFSDCRKAFHAYCCYGHKNEYQMLLRNPEDADVKYEIYCKEHSKEVDPTDVTASTIAIDNVEEEEDDDDEEEEEEGWEEEDYMDDGERAEIGGMLMEKLTGMGEKTREKAIKMLMSIDPTDVTASTIPIDNVEEEEDEEGWEEENYMDDGERAEIEGMLMEKLTGMDEKTREKAIKILMST
jgi:hypothetical protein